VCGFVHQTNEGRLYTKGGVRTCISSACCQHDVCSLMLVQVAGFSSGPPQHLSKSSGGFSFRVGS